MASAAARTCAGSRPRACRHRALRAPAAPVVRAVARAQQRGGREWAAAAPAAAPPSGLAGRCTAAARASTVARAGASGSADESPVGAAGPLSWERLKLPTYLLLWYAFNCGFAVTNKQVLNACPLPWLLATVQLACGGVWMGATWLLRLQPLPAVSAPFLTALVPVTLFHLVGHVAACVSFSKMAVSFTSVIKAAEPVFSVALSAPLLGETYSLAVWGTLLPIVLGCSLSAIKEVSFDVGGLNYALASNLGMVMRNIYSKKQMAKYKDVSGINLYGLISIVGCFILAPIAYCLEGSQWTSGVSAAVHTMGSAEFYKLVGICGVLYHLYNQVSYAALTGMTATSFSVANTLKRVAVIVSSVIVFQNPIAPLNAFGSALAILGAYLYSVEKSKPGAVTVKGQS